VNSEDEHFISDDFEIFLEKVLNSNRIASNSAWAGSVRNILVKLREFLRVVVGRTLDFQIFFVSNTGSEPEKVGTDVGRSIYKPPPRINPIGVRDPFYWMLNSVVRSKRIGVFRKITKFVVFASIVWMLFYSLPFIYHFKFLMPKPIEVENRILSQYDGNRLSTNKDNRNDIMRAYDGYMKRWLVKKMFRDFQLPAKDIYDTYKHFDLGAAVGRLNNIIVDFTRIVQDSTRWPRLNPNSGELNLNEDITAMIASLDSLHTGDENTLLYIRSGRTLDYWHLFEDFLKKRDDLETAKKITDQVSFDAENAKDYGSEESRLGMALKNAAKVKEQKVEQKADSDEAITQYEELKDRINNNTQPAFLLGKAVSELRKIQSKLGSDNSEAKSEIRNYLKAVDKWNEPRTFTFKVISIPDDGHIHIDVTPNGKEPAWTDSTQIYAGDELKIEWKLDDDIYIAYDSPTSQEFWGRNSTGKAVLKGKYDLFSMDGNVEFKDIGKTVVFSFTPSLEGMLPRLK